MSAALMALAELSARTAAVTVASSVFFMVVFPLGYWFLGAGVHQDAHYQQRSDFGPGLVFFWESSEKNCGIAHDAAIQAIERRVGGVEDRGGGC